MSRDRWGGELGYTHTCDRFQRVRVRVFGSLSPMCKYMPPTARLRTGSACGYIYPWYIEQHVDDETEEKQSPRNIYIYIYITNKID